MISRIIDLGKKFLRFAIIFSLALLYPTTLPAGLEDFHSRIIRIAFANGYIRALKYDLDTIMVLKESPENMQKYAKAAVDIYIKEVTELNSQALEDNGRARGGKAFRANSWQ